MLGVGIVLGRYWVRVVENLGLDLWLCYLYYFMSTYMFFIDVGIFRIKNVFLEQYGRDIYSINWWGRVSLLIGYLGN